MWFSQVRDIQTDIHDFSEELKIQFIAFMLLFNGLNYTDCLGDLTSNVPCVCLCVRLVGIGGHTEIAVVFFRLGLTKKSIAHETHSYFRSAV